VFFRKSAQLDTTVHVVEGDIIEAALWMKIHQDLNPVILNMAHESDTPSSERFRKGNTGFAPDLLRRTNISQYFDAHPDFFPLPEFGCVYTPNVLVFRNPESQGYKFKAEPLSLGVITAWTYSEPAVQQAAPLNVSRKLSSARLLRKSSTSAMAPVLESGSAEKIKQKIRGVMNTAREMGHDSVVLSAWGCGTSQVHPPKDMARLFREVVFEQFMDAKTKKGEFKAIVFAIEDHPPFGEHNPEGNVAPFQQMWADVNKPERSMGAKCLVS